MAHQPHTALLFPGQGSQTPDMRETVERHRPDLLELAFDEVGPDVFERAAEGTRWAQPAIYCAALAGAEELGVADFGKPGSRLSVPFPADVSAQVRVPDGRSAAGEPPRASLHPRRAVTPCSFVSVVLLPRVAGRCCFPPHCVRVLAATRFVSVWCCRGWQGAAAFPLTACASSSPPPGPCSCWGC